MGHNKDKSNLNHLISSVELIKPITCGKPWRATKSVAAARFFDESVRNSYARRATTPQTASWRQGEFRASARKRSRRCVTLMRTPVASVSGAQQKKSKKTSQSKRRVFANDVVLNIKTPTEDRLSGVPLAFALCRNIHAGACMLEANNRREIDSFGVRARSMSAHGNARTADRQPARNFH